MFRPFVGVVLLLATAALAQSPAEQQLREMNRQYQSQVAAKDYDGAIESITRMLDVAAAGRVRVNRGQMLYARACFNALTGRKERAISDARASVANGFSDYKAFATDSDLDSLRDDAAFQSFLSTLKQETAPQASSVAPPAELTQPLPVPHEDRPPSSSETQSVIIHLKTAGRETKRVAVLAEKVKTAIAQASAGEFGGVEFGENESTLYMNGPDADRLFTVTRDAIRAFHPLRGSYLVKRYGNDGAKEVRVPLPTGL